MEKHMNFKSNGFWNIVRKWYVLVIAILFVCRVSLWRKGLLNFQILFPFFRSSMNLGRLGPTSHYAGEGSQPVFLFPAPLTAGAETQVWSHCQSQEMANCLEWWKKCAGTFKSPSLGSELELSIQWQCPHWAIPWVWPSSLGFNVLLPAHFLTSSVHPFCHLCESWYPLNSFYLLASFSFYGFKNPGHCVVQRTS